MLQEILSQLDAPSASRNRQVLVQEVHKALLDHHGRNQKVVLIIDEAHLIRSAQTFEELRLLLNCQTNEGFLISLLLLGQTELRVKVAKVPALDQRLAVRPQLKPLTELETGEMVLHRLRVAGFEGSHSPFTPDALHELHRRSGGAPRLISQLADNALLMAFARKAKMVDGFLMHEVASEWSGQEAA
jgi:general secretion pathway protein A